jgi:hypothetical protein
MLFNVKRHGRIFEVGEEIKVSEGKALKSRMKPGVIDFALRLSRHQRSQAVSDIPRIKVLGATCRVQQQFYGN